MESLIAGLFGGLFLASLLAIPGIFFSWIGGGLLGDLGTTAGWILGIFTSIGIWMWWENETHPSDEKLEKDFLNYRDKIKNLRVKIETFKKNRQQTRIEEETLKLVLLKKDFIDFHSLHSGLMSDNKLKNHPILKAEEMTKNEWEIYKKERLKDVSNFWRKEKEEEIDQLKGKYMLSSYHYSDL